LEDFALRRRRGADILDHLARVVSGLGVEAQEGARQLRAVGDRARAGRFHVLLLGGFSSGKSTLLNALIGAPVLPVKVNPCTAILTELVHGETPSVEVRFRDRRPPEHMDPATFLDRYQLRTAEIDRAGAEAADRFGDVDRAVLSWPLPLLHNGVMVLDTPGLDDDEARTERTLASLPEADAVIVVLNATRFLSDLERRTIRRHLLPLGLTNLFFPVTMVDLLDALSDDPARDLEEMRIRARRILGPLCEVDGADRFEERFFFLNARGALQARYDHPRGRPRPEPDAPALDQSGILPFERALARFLVEERGRAQLGHLAATARRIRADLTRQASLDRATADASVEELRQRQEDLEPRFAELAAIADRVARTVDGFVARQQVRVWQDLRAFLAETEERLPEAITSLDLGGLASFDLLTPRGRKRVEERLREELEEWLAQEVAAWQRTLQPKLEESLNHLRTEVAGDARDFDQLAASIVTDFAGGLLAIPRPGADDEVDPVERWFSVAVGAVLLSPATVAAGWTQGYEGALKGAASRLAARVAILALGALLGPIGWLGVVIYVLTDAVLLVLTGGGQLRRVREHVAQQMRGKLVSQADLIRDDLAERVRTALLPLRDGIANAARAEAVELQKLLDRTIAAREEVARTAAERSSAWEEALAALDVGLSELEGLTRVEEPLLGVDTAG